MNAIVTTQLDRATNLHHPVITDEDGEIMISVGFSTPGEALEFGIAVRHDYEILMAKGHSPSVDLPLSGDLQEAPHAK